MPRRATALQAAAFCVTLALAACSGDREPSLSPLPTDGVILAFGDSLTYGTGAKREESYPAVLARRIDHEVINAGIPGELSANGLERLPALLDEHDPDLVILCHGGNDMLRKRSREAMVDNLAEMVRVIRGSGAEVVLVGVPEPTLLGLDPAPEYARLAESLDAPIAEDIISDVLSDSTLRSDRIHPNALGYERIGKRIDVLLRELGALSRR